MALASLVLTFIFGLVALYFGALFSSYQKARATGLPIVITPIPPHTPLWIVFSVPLRPFFERYLPESWAWPLKISTYGFEYRLGYEPCAVNGPSYVICSPGHVEVWTSDPAVIKTILGQPKQYFQSEISIKFLEIFGTNAISSNGDEWSRQRKVIAPIVNERISRSVWNESREQAEDLAKHFLAETKANQHSNSEPVPDSTVAGLRRIAINVLAAAGYGQPRAWAADESSEVIPKGHSMSYIGSLMVIIQHMPLIVFFPKWLLALSIMPEGVQKTAQACQEFPAYSKELIAAERASNESKDGSLLSIVVQASDAGKKGGAEAARVYLSEHEIQGNMFLFTVAGLDTTANTMAFAIGVLAIHQQWQEWLIEEIDQVLIADEQRYEDAYPKLKRMLAFMFETLRLYTPLPHMTRVPVTNETITTSDGSTHRLPAGIDVFVSFAMMHKSPTLWGEDVNEFKPTRWLADDGSIVQPEGRIFAPWSEGPRACPGMKMAQVEFVSTMAHVLKLAKIRPLIFKGENVAEAEARLDGVLKDSQPLITLQMMRPGDLKLEFVRR